MPPPCSHNICCKKLHLEDPTSNLIYWIEWQGLVVMTCVVRTGERHDDIPKIGSSNSEDTLCTPYQEGGIAIDHQPGLVCQPTTCGWCYCKNLDATKQCGNQRVLLLGALCEYIYFNMWQCHANSLGLTFDGPPCLLDCQGKHPYVDIFICEYLAY